jgi:hypothetical protein
MLRGVSSAISMQKASLNSKWMSGLMQGAHECRGGFNLKFME